MVTYYTVGGAVRDEILGVKSKDIDFAVEADSYDEMYKDLIAQGAIIWQERPQYYAIRAKHPKFGNADFTLCRKDGFYSDNRRPDSVEIGTIYDDLARRDFTINAIAKTEFGHYIDPHNGIDDIRDMKLNTVGDTFSRFNEDPLRMLRAVRFHVVRGFQLDPAIRLAFENPTLLKMLEDVAIERIYEELRKCYEWNSWRTLRFFDFFPKMKVTVFYHTGLELRPFIKGEG